MITMDSSEVAARIAGERAEKSRQHSQEEYVKSAVDYARECGWVKEEQLPMLQERYLVPIYRKYLEIIQEVQAENPPASEFQESVRVLNFCLEATHRIGTTDSNNILLSVAAYRRQTRSEYADYAVTAMQEFLCPLLAT